MPGAEGAEMGRPNAALIMTEAERTQLRAIVHSRSLPHAVVRRAHRAAVG